MYGDCRRLCQHPSEVAVQALSASVPDEQSCDCVKATERQSDSKKNMHLRTAGILHQIKQYALRNPDKFTIHTFLQSSEKNKDTLSQSIP